MLSHRPKLTSLYLAFRSPFSSLDSQTYGFRLFKGTNLFYSQLYLIHQDFCIFSYEFGALLSNFDFLTYSFKKSQQIDKQLKSLPEGKLTYSQTGKYSKWYQSTPLGRTYIPKSKRTFAEKLAFKTYLMHLRAEYLAEKKLLKHYLDHHTPACTEQSFLSNPVFKELLKPFFKPLSQELDDWAKTSYPANPFPNKFSTLISPSGHSVRSKSELLIAMALHSNKIPFRYDCALQLDDGVIYPDFTIRHPKTGEYFYYEHFGMADDPKYSGKIGERIQRYISNGIIPGINLIISFETKDQPLDPLFIEETIRKYFLE